MFIIGPNIKIFNICVFLRTSSLIFKFKEKSTLTIEAKYTAIESPDYTFNVKSGICSDNFLSNATKY